MNISDHDTSTIAGCLRLLDAIAVERDAIVASHHVDLVEYLWGDLPRIDALALPALPAVCASSLPAWWGDPMCEHGNLCTPNDQYRTCLACYWKAYA